MKINKLKNSKRIFLISLFAITLWIGGHFAWTEVTYKTSDRVAAAHKNCDKSIADSLLKVNLNSSNYRLLLVAYKHEDELEAWAAGDSGDEFKLIARYEVCAKSGRPGPKTKEGDYQVPEGFYHISHFNPKSRFHLSLGINYPNQADHIRGGGRKLGGDIYIHGGCVTIGCLPITNQKIEELYLLASGAKNKPIPVYIFPCKMNSETYSDLVKKHPEHAEFWQNLKIGFNLFSQKQNQLNFSINQDGKYIFQ